MLTAALSRLRRRGEQSPLFFFRFQDYLRIAHSDCSTGALETFSHWTVERAFVDKDGSARQYELLFLPQEMPKWRNWQTR
jgi:hypothetical protein